MSEQFLLPKDAGVRKIFAMLYGDEVGVSSNSPVVPDSEASMLAVFIDDEDQPVSACICDNKFVAFTGSALTRIGAGSAEDAADSGDFSEMMLGNFHEVMNICSCLFMDSNSGHLRLGGVYNDLAAAPDDARNMITSCQDQADFDVEIPNYGNGGLSFLRI